MAVTGPFGGIAAVVPGIVEAEYFDYGGQGIAYNNIGNATNTPVR
ncbi:unnamed protein product, partial [Scytosiphon promiscuus]